MNPFSKGHFVCGDCNNDFRSLSEFQLHQGIEVERRKSLKIRQLRKNPTSGNVSVDIFKCKSCGFETNRAAILQAHDKIHIIKSPSSHHNNSVPSSSTDTKRVISSRTRKPILPPLKPIKQRKASFKVAEKVHNLKDPIVINISSDESDTVAPEIKPTFASGARGTMGESQCTPRRSGKHRKVPEEDGIPIDFTPLINNIKCCRVCLKKRPEVRFNKIRRIDHPLIEKLKKFSFLSFSSTVDAFNGADNNGDLKIPLYFCRGCQGKIEKLESLIEDMKKADRHFGKVAYAMVSISCALMEEYS